MPGGIYLGGESQDLKGTCQRRGQSPSHPGVGCRTQGGKDFDKDVAESIGGFIRGEGDGTEGQDYTCTVVVTDTPPFTVTYLHNG